MDLKAECGQHTQPETIKYFKKTKTKKRQSHFTFDTGMQSVGEGRPEGTKHTMDERICERDEF